MCTCVVNSSVTHQLANGDNVNNCLITCISFQSITYTTSIIFIYIPLYKKALKYAKVVD